MFAIDEKIRGLPASREQVVALYQSINQPHLAIPGKQAGPAQAFIVGLRGAGGFAVFVYLFLMEVGDCAVYLSEHRNLTPEQYRDEEAEAMAFVESMGFMVDNMNFRGLPPAQQDEMLRTLPVFQREPGPAQAPRTGPRPVAQTGARPIAQEKPQATPAALGRLFTSF